MTSSTSAIFPVKVPETIVSRVENKSPEIFSCNNSRTIKVNKTSIINPVNPALILDAPNKTNTPGTMIKPTRILIEEDIFNVPMSKPNQFNRRSHKSARSKLVKQTLDDMKVSSSSDNNEVEVFMFNKISSATDTDLNKESVSKKNDEFKILNKNTDGESKESESSKYTVRRSSRIRTIDMMKQK